ncbi:MAG TPA: glycosyltransferase family 4 protein [Longimicrobiaceae bacterium]|nr:glycosyltransferase family 4 protein [Longimicrobiaceae bacterium]
MRVLISTDTVGGVWDYTLTLVRALRGRGHEVLLAVIGTVDGERRRALPVGVEVEARQYRLEWMPGAAAEIEPAGEWLAGLARRWRPDLVHLNQMAYAARDLGAPTLLVVHSDVLSWFGEVLGERPGPEWGEYARWVGEGIRSAAALVTPSAYQSALCLRHYGRAADRVIHNGARPPAREPPPRGAPLLVTLGRAWDEAKGMAVVDAAVGLLGGAAPPAHLLGEEHGPAGQYFEARHLTRHGRAARAEVDAWLERASLYVGASLYEPFGLAPLEAALRGCALVLSDIGSFRELWDGCAEFVPKGDARALARAIARLAADPGRLAALAARARMRALSRFTAERVADEYLALYDGTSAGCQVPSTT